MRRKQRVAFLKMLREHASRSDDRHEISVALPSRHYMPMQMIRKSSTGGATEISAKVEGGRPQSRTQALDRKGDQVGQGRPFFAIQQLGRADVAARRHHYVPIVVWI